MLRLSSSAVSLQAGAGLQKQHQKQLISGHVAAVRSDIRSDAQLHWGDMSQLVPAWVAAPQGSTLKAHSALMV